MRERKYYNPQFFVDYKFFIYYNSLFFFIIFYNRLLTYSFKALDIATSTNVYHAQIGENTNAKHSRYCQPRDNRYDYNCYRNRDESNYHDIEYANRQE